MLNSCRGSAEDVDFIVGQLTPDASVALTEFVDYALRLIDEIQAFAR